MPVRTTTAGPRTSGGSSYHGVGFDLDSPLEVGPVLQSAAQALSAGTPLFAKANLEDAATGTSAIMDVEYSIDDGSSWSSIFPAGNGNKLVMPVGSKAVVTVTVFAISAVALNTKFRPRVIQIGTNNPGGYGSIDFVWS